jgi:rhamnosyltransferase
MKYGVIVPTLNAARDWPTFAAALTACAEPHNVLIVDSGSTDDTAELARKANFRLTQIARSEFNHGGTRQWAADLIPDAEIIVYLTQDAILSKPDAIDKLLAAFDDPSVGAAYGRQLPRPEAGPIEVHARLFNYPAESQVRTLAGGAEVGFKSIFLSNSFAAYRRTALNHVAGFPADVIFGEDTVTAAKLLLSGWKIAYAADACVYHSHSYTARQEFQRYFDIGVFHAREAWLLEKFGKTGGEGKRFVISELKYLRQENAALIPVALARTMAKFIGYRIGRMEAKLGNGLKRRLSMHRHFWTRTS